MRNVITTTLFGLCLLVTTILAGQNIPRANFSGPMGAQVNTYNGNLYLERTDVAIPNQDLPLAISFSFNSFRDSTDRGYGYGWSHNFAMRYEEIPEGVVIEREHGRRDTFRISGEILAPPAGIFDVLSKSGTTYTLRDKFGMAYTFANNDNRYLTEVTNTNGNSLVMAYTDSLLTLVTDASGRILELAYSDGHLTSVNDNNFPGGRSWNYSYTDGNQLSCVANPFGDCQSYTYDDLGRLTVYTDERGFELSTSYADDGRVRRLRTCITTVEFAFNEAQGRTIITEQNDGTDQITTHIYDEEGKLVRKTGNCCGYDQLYEYNSDNSISQTTDANGSARTGTYDDFGNTVATRDALSEQQQFTFGDLNRLTSFTDKRGNTTNFSYDNRGNLNRVNQPLDVSLEMLYDNGGNVTSMKNGRGNTTTMAYNASNDLTSVQYPIGVESYEYDNAGNLIRTVDANGNPTSFDYDALNRLETITDALGNTITYTYDAASNLASEIDGNGNLKKYEYDAHNRLISVTTPIGITRYGYDALDNLTSINNAEGHTSFFEYDTRSRLIMEMDAMGFITRYEYDNNGNVIARFDANMQETRYTYDAQNRLLSKTYPGNTDNYAYDANGNLIRASNDNITYEFTYDALNRLTSKYVVEWDKRISYEYDRNGNRTKMTDPDGGETFYTYDANDRLTQLLNPFNELTQFRYDTGGRLIEQINFNGTRATYTYDEANRLLKLSNLKSDGSVISSYEYTYDGNGLRISMREADDGLNLYTYDGENRLTRVVYSDGTTEDYLFDKVGNRTQLTATPDGGTAEVINYTYDAADRIMTAGDVRYSFDGNGNMVRKVDGEEVTEFRWDGENRLVEYNTTGQFTVRMSYGAQNKRITESSTTGNERFVYDLGNLLFKYSLDNEQGVRFQHTLDRDRILNIRVANQSFSYHIDGSLNSPQLIDSVEEMATNNENSWNVYGNSRIQLNDNNSLIQFNNHIKLPEISALDYRVRLYNTSTGRFYSKDLYRGNLRNPSSLNRFSYVENSPLNYTDPTGLKKKPCNSGGTTVSFSGEAKLGIVASGISTIGRLFDEDFIVPKQFSLGIAFSTPDFSGNGEFDLGIVYSTTIGMDLGKTKSLKKLKSYGGSAALTIQRTEGSLINQSGNTMELGGHAFGIGADVIFNKNNKVVGQKFSVGPGLDVGAGQNITGGFSLRHLSSTRSSDNQSGECGAEGNGSQDEDKPVQGPPLPPTPPEQGPPPPPGRIEIPIIAPIDPNEIIGPEGTPDLKWVKGDATLPYTILFENDPELATAPAQRVVLTHEFDDSVNPFSLRIGDFGFGSFYFQVPEDLSFYDTRLDLRDSLGLYLNVIAGIDQEQNQAFWIFESIDPATGFAATLPAEAGFLPVNDSLVGNGEGFVNFTIIPSAGAEVGDRIEAQASIIFDDEEAILTNVELNTIDPERPVSRVNNIDTISAGNYELSWEATDEGASLADVTVFVSTNGGSFLAHTELPSEASGTYNFTGHPDSVYQFFTIARDRVGNVEQMKAVGEPACMAISVVSLVDADAGAANGATEISVTGNNGELTFSWEHDATISGPEANGLAPGDYRVLVTDAAGCEAEAIITIDLVNSTLAPAAAPQIVKIYPVPSQTDITLEYFAIGNVSAATIHDMNGRVLLRQTVTSIPNQINSINFNISGLAAGQYYLRLTSPEGGSSAGRFLKQ